MKKPQFGLFRGVAEPKHREHRPWVESKPVLGYKPRA